MAIEEPSTRAHSWIARPGLAIAALLGLSACAMSFDVERARQLLAGSGEPEAPTLVATPGVDLPPPEGLHARSGAVRVVPLQWNPLLDAQVGGYTIERASAREGPFERIALLADNAATAFVDRGDDEAPKASVASGDLGDAARYFYRVRAYTTAGVLAAEASAVVEATTAPPPEPPAGLRAFSGQARRVPLSWRPSPDPDVAGYVVHRSPASRGPFEPVAELAGRYATTYVDRGLGDLRVFYYRVSARNAAGGEGEPSEPVRTVTKPEPLPPLGLRIEERRLGVNRVAWEPNVEPDLEGYRLLRVREGAKRPEVVAVLAASETTAEDTQVAADEHVSYTAVAFDRDGLESDTAEPIAVASVGYALAARVDADGVHLEWNPRPDERFERARVLRGRLFGHTELGVSETRTFVDRHVEPGNRYRYVVILERADATQAPPSQPIEVRIPTR